MTLRRFRQLVLITSLLALPAAAFAQEAVLSGTVTDATGGVLPGVTITAVHQDTGNKFMAVTDERGAYRIAARAGVYRLTAELQGFRAVTREGLQLLVGQVMTVNLPMLVATAVETVTVSAAVASSIGKLRVITCPTSSSRLSRVTALNPWSSAVIL